MRLPDPREAVSFTDAGMFAIIKRQGSCGCATKRRSAFGTRSQSLHDASGRGLGHRITGRVLVWKRLSAFRNSVSTSSNEDDSRDTDFCKCAFETQYMRGPEEFLCLLRSKLT